LNIIPLQEESNVTVGNEQDIVSEIQDIIPRRSSRIKNISLREEHDIQT